MSKDRQLTVKLKRINKEEFDQKTANFEKHEKGPYVVEFEGITTDTAEKYFVNYIAYLHHYKDVALVLNPDVEVLKKQDANEYILTVNEAILQIGEASGGKETTTLDSPHHIVIRPGAKGKGAELSLWINPEDRKPDTIKKAWGFFKEKEEGKNREKFKEWLGALEQGIKIEETEEEATD